MPASADFAYRTPNGNAYGPQNIGDVVPFEPARRAGDRRNLPGVLTPEEFSARLGSNPILNPQKPTPIEPIEQE